MPSPVSVESARSGTSYARLVFESGLPSVSVPSDRATEYTIVWLWLWLRSRARETADPSRCEYCDGAGATGAAVFTAASGTRLYADAGDDEDGADPSRTRGGGGADALADGLVWTARSYR
jgi:hypothetical protein